VARVVRPIDALTMCPPEELAIAPTDEDYTLHGARVSFPPTEASSVEPSGRLNKERSPYQRAFDEAPAEASRRRREADIRAAQRFFEENEKARIFINERNARIIQANIEMTLGTGVRLDGMHPGSYGRGCRCEDCAHTELLFDGHVVADDQ
jgi:hypothetical protein